jgi:MoaA/NifB/PqqE/SkfB family radical SAM enzyme
MGILYGASIMVTSKNIRTVTSDEFIAGLCKAGCKVIFFTEYVPVELPALAIDDAGRAELDCRVQALRTQNPGQIFISFPGDEGQSNGCLAAGRGFFHINAAGDVEPCPFSPYSDTNIRGMPLREAMKSPLFTRLRDSGVMAGNHGGCVLFEKSEFVEQLQKTSLSTLIP